MKNANGMPLTGADAKLALVQQIATAVLAEVDQHWSMLWYEVRAVADHFEDTTTVVDSAANTEQQIPSPATSIELARQLRDLMYQSGRGNWFTATITLATVNNDIRIDGVYDHTDEPRWVQPVDPILYRQDLEMYPRDDTDIPPWLATQLALTDVDR